MITARFVFARFFARSARPPVLSRLMGRGNRASPLLLIAAILPEIRGPVNQDRPLGVFP